MLTVLEVIKKTTEFFAGKGVESPRLNAELIVGHALALKRMQLYLQFERPLTEAELDKIRPLVRRRSQHEPVQYILGETEFCGLRLKVDRRALIPRPETELLVEDALGACVRAPDTILDLGTGSGAISLALAHAYPAAAVTALELNDAALALAHENAAFTGLAPRVRFLKSDWFSALPAGSRFDLIVANPPYLSAAETAATALEVRGFEPMAALVSGDDGLADLKKIIGAAPAFLAPGGVVALETGIEHHARLLDAVRAAGLIGGESRRDLTGRDRYIIARSIAA